MLEKIIFLLTGLLGFIVTFSIGFRFKNNRMTNIYFIAFIILGSLRFLILGMTEFVLLSHLKKHVEIIFTLSAWPLLYLYFNKLAHSNTAIRRQELFHLIVPILILVLFCIEGFFTNEAFLIGHKIGFVIMVIINLIYPIASFRLLKENIWKRKSKITVIKQQNKVIKQWTQLLFCLFIVMQIRFLIILILNNTIYWYINKNNFLWVSALIWIGLYLKTIYSPSFLYGFDIFLNKIKGFKKQTVIFDNIWVLKNATEITNIQDIVLKYKMSPNIQKYIVAIEHLALNTNCFFNTNFDIIRLAHKLSIPKSHLLFLFKYHSNISFADFKKIIRIEKTILLIEDGYLKSNTMESLAIETGFSSYSPFFKSFKSITGLSPQEYIRS